MQGSSQIPLSVRSFTAASLALPGIRPLAQGAYETLTRWMAHRYQRLCTKVIHFGGSFGRCVPGISDVDFLLLHENPAAVLPQIESEFRKLKRKFLIPGEVHLTSFDHWNDYLAQPFASRLWFFPQRNWRAGFWSTGATAPQDSSAESRFLAAFCHFQRAFGHWAYLLTQSNYYYRSSFIRETTKASALAQGLAPSKLRSGRPIALLKESFLRLHRLASDLNLPLKTAQSTPEVELWNTCIPFWKAHLAGLTESQVSGAIRLAHADHFENWLQTVRDISLQANFQRPQITPVPLTAPMEAVLLNEPQLQAAEQRYLKTFYRLC